MKRHNWEIKPRDMNTDDDPRAFVIHFENKSTERFFKGIAEDPTTYWFILIIAAIYFVTSIHDIYAQTVDPIMSTAGGIVILLFSFAYLLGKQFIKQDLFEKEMRQKALADDEQGDDNGKGETS